MPEATNKLPSKIKELPNKPAPEIERVWADEARKRWDAYKAGKISTVSYEEVTTKHRRSRY